MKGRVPDAQGPHHLKFLKFNYIPRRAPYVPFNPICRYNA